MDLFLFFTELPQPQILNTLDKKLNSLSRSFEPIENGRRLWLTHVPDTATKPLLHPKPFEIRLSTLRLSSAEIEDFRVGLGVTPKRVMICHPPDDSAVSEQMMFAIAFEIVTKCNALLRIDDKTGLRMFNLIEKGEDEFPSQLLDDYPGSVYEVAHETCEGDLGVEWFVDSRWLHAWMSRKYQRKSQNSETSRFATLDYL